MLKKAELETREPKNLGKILTKAKFEENPLPPRVKEVAFFPCNDCIYQMSTFEVVQIFSV